MHNASMRRETLVDVFDDLAATPGTFLVDEDGFRVRRFRYDQVARAARSFAAGLAERRVDPGDRVVFWSANRAEWVAAFWGCVLAGAVCVPVDARSSTAFARRIARTVDARLVLVEDERALHAWNRDADSDSPPLSAEPWPFSRFDWTDTRQPSALPDHRPDDVAEIIFTSGATADPKGVLLTHANIVANLAPIEREILRYRRWARPFLPLRFLLLLPLSHMFGQAMCTLIPPAVPGTVIFLRTLNPADITAAVRRHRVSVLVSVPRVLDVLRQHVVQRFSAARVPLPEGTHWLRRWWRWRSVHRAFGLKFWSFVVGAAPLDPSLESFWSGLGFLVIQGYGLTETAPIVSLNHPFQAGRGSVGKPLPGVDVRLADDGEILVRGANVTRGYYAQGGTEAPSLDDGWLRTGDVGALDDQGRLFVRGRKKEMIVTPDGRNVFPEDVERVLDAIEGVRESAVVGLHGPEGERVHAVVVFDKPLTGDALLDDVVRQANARLADHQRIRTAAIWPAEALPRTEGTGKLRRMTVRSWVEQGAGTRTGVETGKQGNFADLLGRFAEGRALTSETTLEELGLGSLDRVELLIALESRLQTTLDEAQFSEARSIADLERLSKAPETVTRPEDAWEMPRWNRSALSRVVRRVSLATWLLPAARALGRLEVAGREHLDGFAGPAIFAANHQSHFDTPAILAALPPAWRGRIAVAMAKEYFAAHFHPEGHALAARWLTGLEYGLAALLFNAFPLPQREAGARRVLRYSAELFDEGWSILIFPEGERRPSGSMTRFRPGVAVMAARLGVPVVPVHVEGSDRVLPKGQWHPRRGRVQVRIGEPLRLEGEDFRILAARVEEAVRKA